MLVECCRSTSQSCFLSSGASHELSEGGQSLVEITVVEIPYNETRGVGRDQLKVTDAAAIAFPARAAEVES